MRTLPYRLTLLFDLGVGGLRCGARNQFRAAEDGKVLGHLFVHPTVQRL